MSKIIVVDDDIDILTVTQSWLGRKDFEVTTYNNADDLLQNIISLHPDLIVLDINLKGKDGRLVCQTLKTDLPFSVKIILLSGDPVALLSYEEHFADGILNKPFEYDELEKKIKQHLKLI